MKNFFKDTKTLLIIILVIIIIILRQCNGKPSPIETVITKVETRWDTITETIPEYIPKWYSRVERDTIIDTVYIDTTKVLEDYFASYTYLDTLKNDSVTIIINDTISQNKIKNRNVRYDILYPTKTVTIEHYLNNREFYIGPRAGITYGGNNVGLSFVGIEGLFRSKKKMTTSIAVGINQNFGVNFELGLHWKIGK